VKLGVGSGVGEIFSYEKGVEYRGYGRSLLG